MLKIMPSLGALALQGSFALDSHACFIGQKKNFVKGPKVQLYQPRNADS